MTYEFYVEDVDRLLRKRPELRELADDNGLTHEEVVALYAYSRQDYADMNMALRGLEPELLESYRAQIAITASALDKLPDFRGPVFRRADAGDWLDAYQEGAVVREGAFTSSSTEYETQLGKSGEGKVEFVIKSRKGKDITQLSGKGELENEVLFGHGTSFTVSQRVVDTDGTIVIYMDEVPTQRRAPAPRAPGQPEVPAAAPAQAPRGGRKAKAEGPVDLEEADQRKLVSAGFTKKEANRIISHREQSGGAFELDTFIALNPKAEARMVAKLARASGREAEVVRAARRGQETEAEAAQRVGVDPAPYGRREHVEGAAELHNHLKGILTTDDWTKLAFPQHQDDPTKAATETLGLLRRVYDPDQNPGANELYEPHKLAITQQILAILDSPDAAANPARALQRVLTASAEMPFDYTYDPRGLLIDHMKDSGRAEDFVRATVLRLKEQGITYAELQGKITSPGVDAETFAAIAAEHGVVLRMLPHLMTHQFAEGGGGFDETKLQALLFGKDAAKRGKVPEMVGGIDICGPEKGRWDHAGMEQLENAFAIVQRHAELSGRTLVLRPHVGEGYSGSEGQRRLGVETDAKQSNVAQENLGMVLDRIQKMRDERLYFPPPEGKVEIRLGHVTQATEAQVSRMRDLGVIAEVNIGSNMVTGALSRAKDPAGSRLDQHPLLMLLYHDVRTVLSTDAGGVMGTDLGREYGSAADMLDRFRRGETSLTVPDPKDPKSRIVLRYDDLPPEVQVRFHIDHLERSAQEYALEGQARKNRGDTYVPKGKGAKVNRVNIAKKQRALAKRYSSKGGESEEAALSRNLDRGGRPKGMDPDQRVEELRQQLAELQAGLIDAAGGFGTADMQRLVVELRDELLGLLERRLRAKHPNATVKRTSAGSSRLEIEVLGAADAVGAAEELDALGRKTLGEGLLGMLGMQLTVPQGFDLKRGR